MIVRSLLSRRAGLPRARSQPAARQPCTAPPRRRPTVRIVLYAREAGGKLSSGSPLVTRIPERRWYTARRGVKHRSWPKIDHPTLDAPWCIPEHRGASQSTAVHPSSPWGPGQAPLHACMCVCARCLPTPCGVSWCPPLQPSYPSCSQTHPVTHLCPRRLRLPRKVPAAPGEPSLRLPSLPP